MQDDTEALEKINSMFDSLLQKAGEKYRADNAGDSRNKENKNSTSNTDVRYSNKYLYSSLVSKPDMLITTVNSENIPSNRADIIYNAKQNAAQIGKVNAKDGSVTVHVDDIDRDVVIGKKGLMHSLDRRFNKLAPITLQAGQILKNSIQVNELNPRAENISDSYILIGAAQNTSGNLSVVEFVVNRYSNEVLDMDVLYSINKKGTAVLDAPSLSRANYRTTISISDLLDYVNEYFPDILSEDVLKHYGYTERPEGDLKTSVLYSYKNDTGKAYAKAVADNDNKNPTSNTDVRYSIRNIKGNSGKSYGIGVYLDSTLLDNLTDAERKEMVKLYVVDELEGERFIAYDKQNNPVDIMLARKSDKFKNKRGNKKPVLEELYRKNISNKVKQEAVVLVDELVSVSNYHKSKPSKYSHGWLDHNGVNDWDYWNVYIQEKNNTVWLATLNIANTANGEKILYDIDPIKMVEGTVKSAPTATVNSISTKTASVNTSGKNNSNTSNTQTVDEESSVKTLSPIQAHYAEVIRENRNFRQILALLDEMQYSSVRGNIELNSKDINGIATMSGDRLDANVVTSAHKRKNGCFDAKLELK